MSEGELNELTAAIDREVVRVPNPQVVMSRAFARAYTSACVEHRGWGTTGIVDGIASKLNWAGRRVVVEDVPIHPPLKKSGRVAVNDWFVRAYQNG